MNKPLAVVITDTHLNDKNIDLVGDIFRQTFEFCVQNDIRYIFHAGDWFTSRTGQSIACLIATKDILERMNRDFGIEMWAIAGNHDKADQSLAESFLSIFEGIKGFRLVSLAGGVPLSKDLHVQMIPYFTKDFYEEQLADMIGFVFEDPNFPNKAKQILITHSAINGVKNNDGTEVTEGLSQNAYSYFDKVFVGHYHNKSKIGKNIYYIGSAYQANFGEDDSKGITVLYENGDHEQIVLDFPRFVKIPVNVNELDAEFIKEIKQFKETEKGLNLRIVLTGSEQEINSFNKNRLLDLGVSVDKKPDDVELLDPEEEVPLVTYNKENLLEAFMEFCETKKITNFDYGIEILKKM